MPSLSWIIGLTAIGGCLGVLLYHAYETLKRQSLFKKSAGLGFEDDHAVHDDYLDGQPVPGSKKSGSTAKILIQPQLFVGPSCPQPESVRSVLRFLGSCVPPYAVDPSDVMGWCGTSNWRSFPLDRKDDGYHGNTGYSSDMEVYYRASAKVVVQVGEVPSGEGVTLHGDGVIEIDCNHYWTFMEYLLSVAGHYQIADWLDQAISSINSTSGPPDRLDKLVRRSSRLRDRLLVS